MDINYDSSNNIDIKLFGVSLRISKVPDFKFKTVDEIENILGVRAWLFNNITDDKFEIIVGGN